MIEGRTRPTYHAEESFWDDWRRLTPGEQAEFKTAVSKLVEDLRRGEFRKGLRVKRFRARPGVWEMTWADDGRALFTYGPAVRSGEQHVVWLRIGGHEIFDDR